MKTRTILSITDCAISAEMLPHDSDRIKTSTEYSIYDSPFQIKENGWEKGIIVFHNPEEVADVFIDGLSFFEVPVSGGRCGKTAIRLFLEYEEKVKAICAEEDKQEAA